MADLPSPSHTHLPDWTTGKCRACMRPWPCLASQVLLEANFWGAPEALRQHLEWVSAEVDPKWRDQIMGWFEYDNGTGGAS